MGELQDWRVAGRRSSERSSAWKNLPAREIRGLTRMLRKVAWVAAFAITFAWVESAVVVYLREIYYPEGFRFPVSIPTDWLTPIELGREAATLLMLGAVGALAGKDKWERFLHFCLAFAIWDIFYYVWLRLFLGWPETLLAWDILFLIPVPWIAPVLAPVLVSLVMTIASLVLLRLKERGVHIRFTKWLWTLAVAGGLVVLLSFMLDSRVVLEGRMPPPFRWWIFGAGMALAIAAFAAGVRHLLAEGGRARTDGRSAASG